MTKHLILERKENMMELKDKVMIITGASQGLGRYLCTYFSQKGATIVGMARNEAKLSTLKDEIESDGGKFMYFPLDVTDYEGMEKAVGEVVEKFGAIDILINNAGVAVKAPFAELSREDIDTAIDVTLKGAIYCTRAVVPVMIKNGNGGHIINISSSAGMGGVSRGKSNGLYATAKHGINAFGDAIGKYLMDYKIYHTTLCPGGIDTTWWGEDGANHALGNADGLLTKSGFAELVEFVLLSDSNALFRNVHVEPIAEVLNLEMSWKK